VDRLEVDRRRLAAIRFVAFAWLVGRGALLLVVALSRRFVPERTPNENLDFVAFPAHPLWDSFCRWDSGYYDRIARLGYFRHPGAPSEAVFFPAFPYLTRALAPLFGGHFPAGLVINNLALLGALFFLYAVAESRLGESAARRAVILVLVHPATIFFSAYYTEGLFLFAVAGSFYFFERERLLPAALLGALAAATRGVGVVLLPALLIGSFARERMARPPIPRFAWLALIPLGLVAFMVLLYVKVGDPLAFVHREADFGCAPTLPWVTLVRAVRDLRVGALMEWLDLGATLALLLVSVAAAHTLGLAHGVFAVASVLLPLAAGRVRSMERYSASVPAMFLVLAATTGRRPIRWVVFAALGLLMVFQTALFANWYWAD
jgi:hypothetical protein